MSITTVTKPEKQDTIQETVISVLDDDGNVQSRVKLSGWRERAPAPAPPLELPTRDDISVPLPESLPDWAMPLATHEATCQKTAVYRCLSCGGEHEEYRNNPRDLPYAKVCGCLVDSISVEGGIDKCSAPALRRVTYPGEGVALNARRFEPLVLYQSAADPSKISVPGRNYEPTDPGYKRIEITSIAQYNTLVKKINESETSKMRDHRYMHQEYWSQRRKAMRDEINARIRNDGAHRSRLLARWMRERSDSKTIQRYGKPLDAHFHSQLLEFDQGHIQDYCDKDTNWRATRAK